MRKQLAETLQRVVLALDRDEHLLGGSEPVDRQQPERGRAVDQDVVVVVDDRLDRPAESGLPAERRHQFDLGAGQVEACRRDEQALDVGRLDAVLQRHLVHQHVVHRGLEAAVLDAEPGRGVALRVEVDDQRPLAELGETGTDVDRRRRLADATLLVGHGDHPGQRTTDGLGDDVVDGVVGDVFEELLGDVVEQLVRNAHWCHRGADAPRGRPGTSERSRDEYATPRRATFLT